MAGLKIGYARVSTTGQDLTAQRERLIDLGVDPDQVYVDHGLTGTNEPCQDCAKPSRSSATGTPWC